MSGSYLRYFLRYKLYSLFSELFSPIFGKVQTDRQTESDAYVPVCNVHRWAKKNGKLTKIEPFKESSDNALMKNNK